MTVNETSYVECLVEVFALSADTRRRLLNAMTAGLPQDVYERLAGPQWAWTSALMTHPNACGTTTWLEVTPLSTAHILMRIVLVRGAAIIGSARRTALFITQ